MPQSRSLQSAGDDPVPSPWMGAAFWMCIIIAVAVVIRRVVALVAPSPSAPPDLAALDAVFASHATLTLAHVLPALGFVLIAPLLYLPATRYSVWPPRLLLAIGVIVGATAYAMSVYAVGGWVERSAVLLFNSLFLYSLYRACIFLLRGDLLRQRRWMMRAIAILLGIATTRPVMGVFFATSRLTHLRPQQFFGIAFWIGFSINTIAFELWLRRHTGPRPAARRQPASA
jgi:hypothetical protein